MKIADRYIKKNKVKKKNPLMFLIAFPLFSIYEKKSSIERRKIINQIKKGKKFSKMDYFECK